MDAISSTVPAAASASASGSPACAANLYDIPVQDAACAMPYDSSDNVTDIMSGCCNSAPVIAYYDNCGLYCLAQDQSVEDLTDCLFEGGAPRQDVFCSGNVTATATGSSNEVPSSAQASVVAGETGSSGGSNGGSGGSGGNAGSSDDGLDGVDSDDDSSGSGAGSIQGGLGLGKIAVAVLGLLAVPFIIT